MKHFIIALLALSTYPLMAKDLSPFDDTYIKKMNEEIKVADFGQEMKVTYLTKLLEQQEKSYHRKISYLEEELNKTQDRLIEKSMNQEKIEEAMKDKYKAENLALKRELAYTTKSMLEYQRQVEKIQPSEEVNRMIKINTELAAELRQSADKLATLQLKAIEAAGRSPEAKARMPASVQP